jgi:CBS domain containing-hemolysin-like protein
MGGFWLVILGIVLAAFFSGSETALVSLNWIRLEHWVEKRMRRARALEQFVSDPHRFLGTTLVGTNLAIIMTSSVVSLMFSRSFSTWPAGLVGLCAIVTSTSVMLVFGEIIPKVMGRRHSDAITLKVIHPLRVFYWIFSPVIWIVTGIASGLLRTVGIRTKTWRRRLTKDELRLLLTSEGERAGAVDSDGTELIAGIFEFAVTTTGEVMVPRTDVVGLPPDATVGNAVDLVRAHGFSRLPVFSEDRERIEGMVISRDLLGLPRDRSIAEFVRPLPHVPATKRCDDLFKELQAAHQHMAIVVDEHGGLAGIVTMEDLLEELVGEIEDEYDVRRALIQKMEHDLYMVDGRAEIGTVEEALGVKLPESSYNTIAGLVLDVLGRVPEPGDEISIAGLDLRIVSASPTRIGKIRIKTR